MEYLINKNNTQIAKVDKYCNYLFKCILNCKEAIPIEKYNPRGKR